MVTISVLSIFFLCISLMHSSENTEKMPLARVRSKSVNNLLVQNEVDVLNAIKTGSDENPRKLTQRAQSYLPIMLAAVRKSPEQLRISQESPKLRAQIIALESTES